MPAEYLSPVPSGSDPSSEDIAALSETLGRQVDLHFGDGVVFSLRDHGRVNLELFPTVVRVSMADCQLVLPRLPAQPSSEGVVFGDGRSLLSVGASGEVLFQYVPSPTRPEAPTATEEPARGSHGQPRASRRLRRF